MFPIANHRRRAVVGLLAAVALTASACGSSGNSSSGQSAAADKSPSAPTKLTVAVAGIGAFQAPLYIASVKGYFQKEGLDVTLSYVAANALTLVVGDKADIASVGAANALVPVHSGKDTSLIYAQSAVTDAGYVAAATDISSIDQCKRVATTAVGTASYSWAAYYKQALKLKYQILAISDTGAVPTTAQSGAADCAIAPYSTLYSGVASSKLHFIIDPSDPSKLPPDAPVDGPSVGLWGLTDHLQGERGTIVKFMKALQEAATYIKATSDEQLATDLRQNKDFATQPAASLADQIKAERPFLLPNGGQIVESGWVPWLGMIKIGLPYVNSTDAQWSYAKRVDMSYLTDASK